MVAAYTKVFFENVYTTPVTALTVLAPPAGRTWVIRDVILEQHQSYGQLQNFPAVVFFSPSNVRLIAPTLIEASSGLVFHWQGRQALENPNQLLITTYTNVWGIRVTGYDLSTT